MIALILATIATIIALIIIVALELLEASTGKIKFGGGPTPEEVAELMTERFTESNRDIAKKIIVEALESPPVKPYVTMDDLPHSIPYTSKTPVFCTSIHLGQTKLFLSELQFLTNQLEPDQHALVVYAGAAPGNKTGILARMFPDIIFLLVDPAKFDVRETRPIYLRRREDKPLSQEEKLDYLKRGLQRINAAVKNPPKDHSKRIYIIEDYYDSDISETIKATIEDDVFFVSDIRTDSHVMNVEKKITNALLGSTSKLDKEMPDTLDILWNDAMQYNWILALQPKKAMLKWRHPFYEDADTFEDMAKNEPYASEFARAKKNGIDFLEHFKKRELVYFDGDVFLQAWPGVSSTETRLVTDCKKLRNWGTPKEYEDKLFYYNMVGRQMQLHENEFANRETGYDHCNDCALTTLIYKNYMNKFDKVRSLSYHIDLLQRITGQRPKQDHHGLFFSAKDWLKLGDTIDKYNKSLRGQGPLPKSPWGLTSKESRLRLKKFQSLSRS